MKLKKLISLRILSFLAYLTMLLAFYMLFLYEAFYYILSDILGRKVHILNLDDISGIYMIFMFIAYILVVAAVIEFFKRRKSAPADITTDDNPDTRPLYKRIFSFLVSFLVSFLDSVLFWFGLLFEAVFVFFYTLLCISIYFF